MFKIEKVPDINKFYQVFHEIQNLEWRENRKVNVKKYERVINMAKETVHPAFFQKLREEFWYNMSRVIEQAVNTQDQNGHTPLHIAAFAGDFRIVKFLVESGSDRNLRDYRGNSSALDLASTKVTMKYLSDLNSEAVEGNEKDYMYLVHSGYIANESGNNFLINSAHAAIACGPEMLSIVLNTEPNNVKEEKAADPKKAHIPKRYVKKQVPLKENKEWNAHTPLHYACAQGEVESAKLLIDSGVNLNSITNYQRTPLHLAAENNHVDVIRLLISSGAEINPRDHQKCTPLMLAAKKNACEALRYLLISRSDIRIVDYRSWTALHYAAYHNHPKSVKILVNWDIDSGFLVSHKNSQGKTAVMLTSDGRTKFAFKTFWEAARKGDLDASRQLFIRQGEMVNTQTEFKRNTPLIIAVRARKNLMVRYLLDNGADADLCNADGMSALDYAKEIQDDEICKLLASKSRLIGQRKEEEIKAELAAYV